LTATAAQAGVLIVDTRTACDCDVCTLAKASRTRIGRSRSRRRKATAIMDRVHWDLMGPINATLHGTQKERVKSLGGNVYVLVCVEEYSRYVIVKLLRDKTEAADALVDVITFLKTQTGLNLKELHGDGGTEVCNEKVSAFCKANGTIHTATPRDSPSLNGIAERMNRSLMEMTRAMLIHAAAHVSLWGEAILTAAFIHNCTIQHVDDRTEAPSKVLLGITYDPSRLRVFGCDVWRTLPADEQTKLSPRAENAMFVGYSNDGTYRILLPSSMYHPIRSRDVVFDETSFTASAHLVLDLDDQRAHDIRTAPKKSQIDPGLALGLTDELEELRRHTGTISAEDNTETVLLTTDPQVSESTETDIELDSPASTSTSSTEEELEAKHESDSEISVTPNGSEQEREIPQSPPQLQPEPQQIFRRSTRQARPFDPGPFVTTDVLSRRQDAALFGALIAVAKAADVLVDPNSYKQALSRPDAPLWSKAISEELSSLFLNKVFKLVQPPTNAHVLGHRWVFKTKMNERNQPVRWKARLVAKGYQQEHGVNFDETFAPVARHKSIKLLLTIVNELDLELKQIDFITAFLNAPLDYEIYMEQPEGMSTRGDGRVLLLLKALYGLKQAPRQWNIELHNWLIQRDYRPIIQDPCIYVKNTTAGRAIILALYVDDTAVAYHIKDEAIWLADKAALSAAYPITDMGDCQWLLGMEIRRDRAKSELTLSQLAYTERVLQQFDLIECNTRPLPMAYGGELGPNPRDGTPVKPLDAKGKRTYQSIVGSLLYAACQTRMDLTFATSKLAQFCAAPAEHHLVAAKYALRYLASTRTLGIIFRRSARKINLNPTVYPDASWISEVDSGRSHSGVITLLNGNPIHWWSKRQSMVALSSTEAEYIALGEAAKDAVWLREWLTAVLGVTTPIRVLCDNQAAIKIAANNADSARTRHYSARHHFVRELIRSNQLKLEWTSTHEQAADMLTKQLTEEKLRVWRDRFLAHVPL